VSIQLGLCLGSNGRFGAFTAGFLSQYKPCIWVSVTVQTGGLVPIRLGLCLGTNLRAGFLSPVDTFGSMPLQLGISTNRDKPLHAFRFGFLSQ
jgi:hypothetical protein